MIDAAFFHGSHFSPVFASSFRQLPSAKCPPEVYCSYEPAICVRVNGAPLRHERVCWKVVAGPECLRSAKLTKARAKTKCIVRFVKMLSNDLTCRM